MLKTKWTLLLGCATLLLSAVLLAGTSFAWFTDSIINNGNSIVASDNYAAISVSDADSLNEALQNTSGSVTINLEQSLPNVKLDPIKGTVTMNLGENLLSSSTTVSGATITVADGGSLTINAQANNDGSDYTAGGLKVTGEQTLLKVNGGRYGVSGAGGAEVSVQQGKAVLNDGIFSSSGSQGHAVMASEGGVVYVNGGRYSCAGAQSVGFYADGGTIY